MICLTTADGTILHSDNPPYYRTINEISTWHIPKNANDFYDVSFISGEIIQIYECDDGIVVLVLRDSSKQ